MNFLSIFLVVRTPLIFVNVIYPFCNTCDRYEVVNYLSQAAASYDITQTVHNPWILPV